MTIRPLFISALLLSACGSDRGDASGGAASGPMTVQVHVLRPAPLEHTFTTSGTLLPNEEVELRSELSGRVTHIGFEEGRAVSAGQVLLRINDEDLQARLRKAEAALQLAIDAERRQEQLLAVQGVSREAFDAAVAQRVGMQAEVDDLRATLARTVIRAPFAGVVGLRSVSVGGYVSPTTVIAHLKQTDPLKLDFAVPERHAAHMRQGIRVTFSLEGDTAVHSAEVYAVEPGVDMGTRSLKVRARGANPGGRSLPGAFARVNVRLDAMPDALTVPADALIPDIRGQQVMLLRNGKAQGVRVQIGLRTEDRVQLLGAVQPGDTVITSALLAVRDGMPVRPAGMQDRRGGADGGGASGE